MFETCRVLHQINLRNIVSRWLLLQEYITMHGPLNVKFAQTGSEPAIPAIKQLQNYALESAAIGIGEYLGLPVGSPAALTIRITNAKLTRERHYGEKFVRI
jgi:hypothetical protein